MANWKVLTIISVAIGLVGLIVVISLFTATGGYVPFDYGVVLDAGSSHTQVTLYHWLADKNRCTGVVEELNTCRIEKGISKYNMSDMKDIGEDLLKCVSNVSREIEKERLFKTPIYLGATAGMRLLNLTNPNNVSAIFKLIGDVFRQKTSLQTKKIDIISGQDEGLFSWVTNNYLMGKLIVDKIDDNITNATVGMLDMGGASAQIAYRISDSERKNSSDEVNVRLYGINHTVKASSNLCYGVDQAMLRFLKYLIQVNDNSTSIDNPCLNIGITVVKSGNEFKDQICLKSHKRDIDYTKTYTFNGISNEQLCSQMVSDLLNKTQCDERWDYCFRVSDPPPLGTQFFAISTYYYTVRIFNETKQMSKNEFFNKTSVFCNSDKQTILKNPLVVPKYAENYCFQMNYIFNTLRIVYQFPDEMYKYVVFTDTIKNTQLGWSLGFMINATNVIAAEKPTPPVVPLFSFVLVSTFCTIILLFSIYFGIKWSKEDNNKPKEQYEPITVTTQ